MIVGVMNKPDVLKIADLISKWSLKERILATLIYFDMFQMALGEDDLSRLILGEKTEIGVIKGELSQMAGLVVRNGGITALHGRDELLEIHEGQKRKSFDLCRRVEKWAWVFRRLPFVELVAVCNYLPLGVVDACSDIDIFVVTRAGRIFVARVFVTVFLHLLGLRRHGEKVKNRFCLSFYVSEKALGMREILLPDDIYFAYWMIALWPVYGEKVVWEKLQAENQEWVGDYLEGGRLIIRDYISGKSLIGRFWEKILNGKLGNWLERRLREFFQKRHAARKDLPANASVIVDEKRLKFHNNDRREYYRDKWLRRLEGFGIL